MRTLVSQTYVTSVNSFEAADGTPELDFILGLPDDPAEEERIAAFLSGADCLIMGRVLYELWSSRFQGADAIARDHPFAPIYAATPKVVFSRTLATAAWENTTINRGDLTTEVEALKRDGDGYMIVTGRSGISRSLLHADLIDEFRISVFPMLSGQGNRVFDLDTVGETKFLDLVHCHPLTNGAVILHYRRRR